MNNKKDPQIYLKVNHYQTSLVVKKVISAKEFLFVGETQARSREQGSSGCKEAHWMPLLPTLSPPSAGTR